MTNNTQDIRNQKSDISVHKSVLLKESIDGLEIKKGDIFFDGTVGSGGHDLYVCEKHGKGVRIIGVDQDKDALERATARLSDKNCNVTYRIGNFRNIKSELEALEISEVNKVLLDLGLSSDQYESSGRGFSFLKDEPLLMTLAKDPDENTLTAMDIVNTWQIDTLQSIIFAFGEERYATRIAKKIVEARQSKRITTTTELVEIIKSAVPISYQKGRIHFATRTFQALRMTVNDDTNALKQFLHDGFDYLAKSGRIAVISFHSIEDRIVKDFFREKQKDGLAKVLTKKPIIPSADEVRDNPRSRSSKLRIIEKI